MAEVSVAAAPGWACVRTATCERACLHFPATLIPMSVVCDPLLRTELGDLSDSLWDTKSAAGPLGSWGFSVLC